MPYIPVQRYTYHCLHCNKDWTTYTLNPKKCKWCHHYDWDIAKPIPPKQEIHCSYCNAIIERHISPSLIKEHNFCNLSHVSKYYNKKTPNKVHCAYCGKKIERHIKPSNIKTINFCNITCKAKYQSKSIDGLRCSYCNKPIPRKVTPTTLGEHIFCCTEHVYLYRIKKVEVSCSYCGASCLKVPSQANKGNNHFCNVGHQAKYMEGKPKTYPSWAKGLTKETSDKIKQIAKKNSHPRFPYWRPWNKGLTKKDAPSLAHNYPAWNKGLTKETCDTLLQMGKKVSITNTGKKRSPETGRKISKAISGEKHGMWKGGLSFEPYSAEFNKHLKQEIKKRDNYTCQLCFKHQNDNIILIVHHIDFNKQNCDPSNLIILCQKCNLRVNHNRDWWTVHFQKLLESHTKVNARIRKEQNLYNEQHYPSIISRKQ